MNPSINRRACCIYLSCVLEHSPYLQGKQCNKEEEEEEWRDIYTTRAKQKEREKERKKKDKHNHSIQAFGACRLCPTYELFSDFSSIFFFPSFFFIPFFFLGRGCCARELSKPINFGSFPLAGQNSGASRPLMCAQHFKIRTTTTTTRFLRRVGSSIDYRPCNF